MHSDPVKKLVQEQFGATAQSYVTSATHAHGADLQRMIELAQPRADDVALDIATGGGHTALAFAPHVREVVATDLTAEMLAAAEAFVRGQGIANVRFEHADAEALPFADASFDLVTTRIAPHHFPNPQQYVREVARVLRPGGRFVLDDNMAPEDEELAAFMNRFEQWRDPSHVRAHSVSEWRAWIEAAGMRVAHADPLQLKPYDFATWVERMRVSASDRAALEQWLIAAPARCREFFGLVVDNGRVQTISGAFAIILARKESVPMASRVMSKS